MAQKYKIKITKAYYIAIEDKDGYEVASDWSFLDYTETKKIAKKMLAEVERREHRIDFIARDENGNEYIYFSYDVEQDNTEVKPHNLVPLRTSEVG